jgi:hypothetical protein
MDWQAVNSIFTGVGGVGAAVAAFFAFRSVVVVRKQVRKQ